MKQAHRPIPRGAAALFASLTALTACASIESTSTHLANPEFAGRTWSKACVAAPETDLTERQAIETRIVARIRSAGGDAVAWSELMFPGKEYADDVVAERVAAAGCDAVLILSTQSVWTEERWVPPTATTMVDPWYGGFGFGPWGTLHPYGYGFGRGFASTTVWGGYPVQLPRAVYELRLIDTASDDVAWIATSRVLGGSGVDWEDLRERAVDDTVDELLASGRLGGVAPPPGAR